MPVTEQVMADQSGSACKLTGGQSVGWQKAIKLTQSHSLGAHLQPGGVSSRKDIVAQTRHSCRQYTQAWR